MNDMPDTAKEHIRIHRDRKAEMEALEHKIERMHQEIENWMDRVSRLEVALRKVDHCHHRDNGSHNLFVHKIFDQVLPAKGEE